MADDFDVDAFTKKYNPEGYQKLQDSQKVPAKAATPSAPAESDFDEKEFTRKYNPEGYARLYPDDVPKTTKEGEEPGTLETVARAGFKGITYGLGNKILSAAEAAVQPGDFGERFRSNLRKNDEGDAAAEKANPKTFKAVEFGAGILPAFTGPAGFAASVIGGGLAGVGASDAIKGESVSEIPEAAKEFGKGALLGGLFHGATQAISPLASAISKRIPQGVKDSLLGAGKDVQEFANEQAVKAAGVNARDYAKLEASNGIQRRGQVLNDEGIIKPFTSVSKAGERIAEKKQNAGAKIGDIVANVDKEAKAAGLAGDELKFSNKRIADKINAFADQEEELSVAANEVKKLRDLADTFSGQKKELISLEQAGKIKKKQYQKVPEQKLNTDDTIPTEYKKDVYKIIQDEMDQVVGRTGQSEEYAVAKNTYGQLKDAQKNNAKAIGREGARSIFSLPAKVIAGDLSKAQAVAVAAAHDFARKYGNSVAASTANGLAKILGANPNKLGGFLPQIVEAAKSGPAAMAFTHEMLLKEEPSYEQIFQNLEKENTTPMQRRLGGIK